MGNWYPSAEKVSLFVRLSKKFRFFLLLKTITKSRYTPEYDSLSGTVIRKVDPSTTLPSKLQKLKTKILSGNDLIVYENSSKHSRHFHI